MTMSDSRLPRTAYTDQTWYDRERTELFRDAWSFIGIESDLAKAGDTITGAAGPYPLFVVRSETGELRAFHNICRHRGAELVEGNGSAGSVLVCPYHRWSYGLDGALRGAPDWETCFAGADKASLALKPAAVGVFQNLVFVNPNPQADFQSWIGKLKDHGWPHDLHNGSMIEGPSLVYDMKCDWKVFAENAIDGYHLAYLHAHSLGGPPPDRNVWERWGDNMIWYATDDGAVRYPVPAKVRHDLAHLPPVPGVSMSGYGGVYYFFPTTFVVPTPYGLSVSRLVPLSAGRCELHARQWAQSWGEQDGRQHVPGYDPDSGRITSDRLASHPLETGDFQTEDVWMCEKVQRGLESPAYEHGPLSKGAGAEDPIRWFHDSYARLVSLDGSCDNGACPSPSS